jgi:hypothetical protein
MYHTVEFRYSHRNMPSLSVGTGGEKEGDNCSGVQTSDKHLDAAIECWLKLFELEVTPTAPCAGTACKFEHPWN